MTLLTENDYTVKPATPRTVQISCNSHVLSETFVYIWEMKDFNRIPFIAKYPIYSPTFKIGERSESLWQLVMTKHTYSPNKNGHADNCDGEGTEEFDSDQEVSEPDTAKNSVQQSKMKSEKIKRIGLRLVMVEETSVWEVVKYYFTLKASNGIKYSTDIIEEANPTENELKPMYTYITENNFKCTNFFQESTLILSCYITLKCIEGGLYEAPETREGKNCAEDLKLLYYSGKFHDVILVAEGIEIEAHKSVLFARARAFESILQDNKDSTKQKVDLKLSEDVGRALVSFMYCGSIKEDFPVDKCIELYEAAQTYGVSNLKKFCSKYFKNHLDPEVCLECLEIDEHVEDCLEVVRKIGSKRLKRILSKLDTCSHKAMEV